MGTTTTTTTLPTTAQSTTTQPTTTQPTSTLAGLSSTPSTTQVGPQAGDAQLNQFLQLLTAQLQNQDPMQPTDPTQFVSQLAQFSTVEQLVQSNTTLTSIGSSISGLALGQYSAMINHQVTATTSSVTLGGSGSSSPAPYSYKITTTGLTNQQLQVLDSSGNLIRSIPVSGASGQVTFDGTDGNGNQLPAGTYQLKLVGTDTTGATQTAGTLSSSGTINQVVQGSNGSWQLQLDNGAMVDPTTITSLEN
jgi:flagellar basal-body rod modification protein FlgD